MTALQFTERLFLRVPPQDVWRFLYDTDRLNRLIKLPAVNFQPHPDRRRKGHFLAEMKLGPLQLRYEEFPFEWVEESFYRVLRRFSSGPLAQIEGGVRLWPKDGGTDLEVFAEILPRNAVGAALARAFAEKLTIGLVSRQARSFEKGFLAFKSRSGLVEKVEVSSSALATRCVALEKTPVDQAALRHLRDLIENGSANDVTRMRPFPLAARWEADRHDVLRLLLHATKAGLVDLKWEILCPHCQAPVETRVALESIPDKAGCDTCEIHFGVDWANAVEAVFAVNAGVRKAERAVYCIGGPANSARVLAQFRLAPGEKRVENLAVAPGLLALRSYQSPHRMPLEVTAAGPKSLQVNCGGEISLSSARMAAGGAEVALQNNLREECLLVFEHETWKESAATAAIVTTLQDFRDLFPAEAVAPGRDIGLGRLAVLFTDLSGSTELYERLGDVKAFDFVQSHFQYLVRLVARHRGGVVKTMGDAIMAVFNAGLDAASAAVAMQEDWDAFVGRYNLLTQVRLRVGLHEGPAVLFNNKGANDYFGGTVNMAARIQGKAEGGEIVISQSLRDDPEVRAYLTGRFSDSESFSAHLKGISDTQTLHRFASPKRP